MGNLLVGFLDAPWLAKIPFQKEIAAVRLRLDEIMTRRRIYQRTFAELSRCTDRDLKDLGFVRSDIHRIACAASEIQNKT